MKASELIKKLKKAGFVLVKGKKNKGHDFWQHPDGRFTSLSRSTKEIPNGTLDAIRKQTKLDI